MAFYDGWLVGKMKESNDDQSFRIMQSDGVSRYTSAVLTANL